LDEAEVAEVVRGAIAPCDGERRLARTRQPRVLGKKDVEGDFRAGALLPEDTEMARQALFERVTGALVERDRQADRRRSERMRRAAHAVGTELFAQMPVDGRKSAGATHHVQPGQLAPIDALQLAARVAHG